MYNNMSEKNKNVCTKLLLNNIDIKLKKNLFFFSFGSVTMTIVTINRNKQLKDVLCIILCFVDVCNLLNIFDFSSAFFSIITILIVSYSLAISLGYVIIPLLQS